MQTSTIGNDDAVTQQSDSIEDTQPGKQNGVDQQTETPEETTKDYVTLPRHVFSMWYLYVIILTPIVCTPLLVLVDGEFERQGRCGYVIVVMAVFWSTEAMPIGVTSLLPVILFPMLGVLDAKKTSAAYFNDTSMLFVGGLIVAIAIEVWNVHKRIALLVLRVVGAEPRCLLLGMILVTWFLSMWISNTATTAMMMTIVQALLEQFEELYGDKQRQAIANGGVKPTALYDNVDGGQIEREISSESGSDTTADDKEDAGIGRLRKALCLSVAYAANIGGTASLTGTGPNLVFAAAADEVFSDRQLKSPISFTTWFIFGLPLSFICVCILWGWMVLVFLRCRGGSSCVPCLTKEDDRKKLQQVNDVIRGEYNKLGPVSFAQCSVLACFILLVILWISRDVGGVGGWSDLYIDGYVRDSTPSILVGVLMFVLPSRLPEIFRGTKGPFTPVTPLLQWHHIHEKMPWSLYLLLGGGYALATASKESGLSTWLGDQLLVFGHLDKWLMLTIIAYIVTFATEVTSNTAIATLMMPILSELALSLELNPLFFMFPAAIATSFAFMLPVATPPNAIVFSTGSVRVIDMVTCGFFLNIVCVPVLIMATATWGNAYFGFDTVPREFINVTIATE